MIGPIILMSASAVLADVGPSIAGDLSMADQRALAEQCAGFEGGSRWIAQSSPDPNTWLSIGFEGMASEEALIQTVLEDAFAAVGDACPQSEVASQWEVPAPPGGSQMVLSGLLVLGSFQCLRSVKGLQWAAVPEWYHLDGPLQIGHRTALDLDFGFAPAVLAVGEQPPTYHSTIHQRLGQTFRAPRLKHIALPISGPRAPPVAAVHPSCRTERDN